MHRTKMSGIIARIQNGKTYFTDFNARHSSSISTDKNSATSTLVHNSSTVNNRGERNLISFSPSEIPLFKSKTNRENNLLGTKDS